MKINLEQIKALLNNCLSIQNDLASNVNAQNEHLVNIIQNIGSSDLAYNSLAFADSVEGRAQTTISYLGFIKAFLDYQIKNYTIISTNAQDKINSLVTKLDDATFNMSYNHGNDVVRESPITPTKEFSVGRR